MGCCQNQYPPPSTLQLHLLSLFFFLLFSLAPLLGLTSPPVSQEDATVGQVRQILANLTEVQPKRQKIIGLGRKPNPEDEQTLASLQLKGSGHTFMMVGCKEAVVLSDLPESELPAVINDLDWDYQQEEYKNVQISPEYRAQVEDRLSRIKIHNITQPRKGKKLLVLDLDFTLLDSADIRNSADRIEDLKRPYCDEFLERLWPHYDIVVWSQTSWKWLEIKLSEMGILQHPDRPPRRWNIAFVLDKQSMFSVKSILPDKKIREHEVRREGNTIHCLPRRPFSFSLPHGAMRSHSPLAQSFR